MTLFGSMALGDLQFLSMHNAQSTVLPNSQSTVLAMANGGMVSKR